MTEYKLRELLEIKNGKDYKHLSEGEIPVYGSGGLMTYVDESLYQGESILLPRKGSLSNIQYVNEQFWTVDTIYYSVIDTSKTEPYYLYRYLTLLDLKHLNSGTGVPSMTFGAYYDIPIKLPNLNIQKQIAKVLSDLDAKIEVNNKINQELESMAKTLYDYWFVQFDFPDENGKPYKSSGGKMVYNEELKREIPEGWEVGIIENLLAKEQLGGKTLSSEYLDSGNIPIIDQSIKFICGYTNDESKRIKAKVPRIVFGDHTRILKLINFDFARGADGTQILLSKEERVPQHFFYHSLLKIDLSNYGYARHFKFLKDTKTIIPYLDVVENYEEKAKTWFEMIWTNLKQNQKLSELRDWLLPMLMNGQVSVKEAS